MHFGDMNYRTAILYGQFTVKTVFLSMTKIPSTLNPIGSPFRRLRNILIYTGTTRLFIF